MPSWSRHVRSHLREDFRRTTSTDGRITLAIWRLGQAVHGVPGPTAFALRRLHGLLDFLWVRVVIGAELPRSVTAGPGIELQHAGRGVILHPSATLGAGVTLYQRVTVGVRGSAQAAVILDRCYLGANCTVIGEITVGPDAAVGAGAVVLTDVPAGHRAVGVPAKVTPRAPAVAREPVRPEVV